MTPTEATDLALRIAQTWPRGIATQVWEEELVELDAGRAGTALAKLRRSEKNAPTIAVFFEVYQTISTTDRSTKPTDCDTCGNTGVTARLVMHEGVEIWGPVSPCRCPWGEAKAPALAKAVLENERELDRLLPSRHQNRTAEPATAGAPPAPLF